MKISTDSLNHFLFEDSTYQAMPIRGNIVHLNHTFSLAMQHQCLPTALKQALGELMAASALLCATIKMDGVMVLQLQSQGALKLLVVECSSDLKMRATAKWDTECLAEINDKTFIQLVQNGQFVITLDPTKSEANQGQTYQGIVPIEGDTIAQMLENYMLRSQQIDTRLWLHCDNEGASGMLLQKLPNQHENDADAWNRVNHLANTMTNDELQNLAPETLLSRLFVEENVRLFEEKPTQFDCSCSPNSVASMLRLLGADEVESILAELGHIEVNCDFCNKHYAFDAIDASLLFNEKSAFIKNRSQH